MTIKQYNNVLFTFEDQQRYTRFLSGKPVKTLCKNDTKGLVFSEGQIFSYAVGTVSKVSAWIVKNEVGYHNLPYLEKSALLLLEATGRMRVQRLVKTIQVIEEYGYSLSDFSIDIFIQLDSLLAGKNYREDWIIEKVSHEKL